MLAKHIMFKRISLTRNKLFSLDFTLSKGVNIALSHLHESKCRNLYEEYDGHDQDWIDKYGYRMEDFGILTSLFEISYDKPKISKRWKIFNSVWSKYLRTSIAPKYYRPYHCFFDCIHYRLNLNHEFDISKIRRKMKISNNVEVLVGSIKWFVRNSNTSIIIYGDSISYKLLVMLYKSVNISTSTVELVLHKSHYYLLCGDVRK